MNGTIRKPIAAQVSQISSGHSRRGGSQFGRIDTKRTVSRRQGGLPPIGRHGMHKPVRFLVIRNTKIGDLNPEVVGMGAPSVEAMIFC